jgi:hypothetical protein
MAVPLERVVKVVQGRDMSMARSEAFVLLASSSFEGKERLLASVIEDVSEPLSIRSAAAVALGRIESRDAEDALLRLTAGADERVLPDVLRSLGPIASPAALSVLDGLIVTPGGPIDTAARYAAALISHRHRLPGHDLPFPDDAALMPAPAGSSRPIDFRPTPTDRATQVLEDVARHPFAGFTSDPQRMSDIRCGNRPLTLCLNREVVGGGTVEGVTDSKAVLGLVALESPETGQHSVAYVILGAPASTPGMIELFVLRRSSGRLVLAGSAQDNGTLQFTLRSVSRPGASSVLLRGALEKGELRIEEAIASTLELPGREPGFLEPAARPALVLNGEVQ